MVGEKVGARAATVRPLGSALGADRRVASCVDTTLVLWCRCVRVSNSPSFLVGEGKARGGREGLGHTSAAAWVRVTGRHWVS
jgi:hypothetical protein